MLPIGMRKKNEFLPPFLYTHIRFGVSCASNHDERAAAGRASRAGQTTHSTHTLHTASIALSLSVEVRTGSGICWDRQSTVCALDFRILSFSPSLLLRMLAERRGEAHSIGRNQSEQRIYYLADDGRITRVLRCWCWHRAVCCVCVLKICRSDERPSERASERWFIYVSTIKHSSRWGSH